MRINDIRDENTRVAAHAISFHKHGSIRNRGVLCNLSFIDDGFVWNDGQPIVSAPTFINDLSPFFRKLLKLEMHIEQRNNPSRTLTRENATISEALFWLGDTYLPMSFWGLVGEGKYAEAITRFSSVNNISDTPLDELHLVFCSIYHMMSLAFEEEAIDIHINVYGEPQWWALNLVNAEAANRLREGSLLHGTRHYWTTGGNISLDFEPAPTPSPEPSPESTPELERPPDTGIRRLRYDSHLMRAVRAYQEITRNRNEGQSDNG